MAKSAEYLKSVGRIIEAYKGSKNPAYSSKDIKTIRQSLDREECLMLYRIVPEFVEDYLLTDKIVVAKIGDDTVEAIAALSKLRRTASKAKTPTDILTVWLDTPEHLRGEVVKYITPEAKEEIKTLLRSIQEWDEDDLSNPERDWFVEQVEETGLTKEQLESFVETFHGPARSKLVVSTILNGGPQPGAGNLADVVELQGLDALVRGDGDSLLAGLLLNTGHPMNSAQQVQMILALMVAGLSSSL